jgi:hypothetical protein
MLEGSPIERAAAYAELARSRAIEMRQLEAWQGSNSRWKERFGHAAEVHERAAELQERAVSYLLVRPPHPLSRKDDVPAAGAQSPR